MKTNLIGVSYDIIKVYLYLELKKKETVNVFFINSSTAFVNQIFQNIYS